MTGRGKAPSKNPETSLSGQQERFCREYLTDFNATQAAIRAEYSPRSAYAIGSALLKKHEVQEYLKKLQTPVVKKLEITAERIMQEVAALAFSNILDYSKVDPETGLAHIDLREVTREQAAAISSLESQEMPPFKTVENGEEVVREVLKNKIRLWDKADALDKLMRRYNLIQPIEVNVNHTGKIQYEPVEAARRVAFMLAKADKEKKKQGVVHENNQQETEPHG